MIGRDMVELQVTRVNYYSPHDESCFFDWLNKMRFVKEFHSKGDALLLSVDRTSMTRADLEDLIGFFYRYDISMPQLKVFDCPEYSGWFRNREKYWYYRVFRSKAR